MFDIFILGEGLLFLGLQVSDLLVESVVVKPKYLQLIDQRVHFMERGYDRLGGIPHVVGGQLGRAG